MAENRNVTEPHGCIVCGKVYSLLVVYSPTGQLVDCTVTSSSEGRRVPDARRPLVACITHSAAAVEAALTKRYPGQDNKKDEEDEEA